jgi:YbbR domain-containing protein
VIEILTRNAGWKVFSLLVSAMLWFTYASDPEIGAYVSAPVEYKNMPEELEIGSELAPSVSLDVRGPSAKVTTFSAARPAVALDFSGVHKPGEVTYQINEQNVDVPSGVRLVRAIPAQIRLEFERRTRRDVPVQVRFSGAPPAGYHMERYQVSPRNLTVVGPESHVEDVEYAVTDPVDLSSLVATGEFQVNAFISDPHVRFERPVKISVKVLVEKR